MVKGETLIVAPAVRAAVAPAVSAPTRKCDTVVIVALTRSGQLQWDGGTAAVPLAVTTPCQQSSCRRWCQWRGGAWAWWRWLWLMQAVVVKQRRRQMWWL